MCVKGEKQNKKWVGKYLLRKVVCEDKSEEEEEDTLIKDRLLLRYTHPSNIICCLT